MKRDDTTSTLIFNADILCMDEARSTADAIVYAKGVITFVGCESQARVWLAEQGESFIELDGEGACILPGFIDAHLHPMLMSVYEHNIDFNGVTSLEEMNRMIASQVSIAGEEDWILGLQLDEQLLPAKRLPDRHDLDQMCSDRPLIIFKRDGHSIAANSLALQRANIDAGTEPVEGGTIEHDEHGELTGILREAAIALMMAHYVAPSMEQFFQSTAQAFSKLTAQGITSIGAILQTDNEGPSGASGAHERIAMEALAENSPFAIYSILIGESVPDAQEFTTSALTNAQHGHKTQAFKIFADGTLGSCTACMHQGFFDHPEKVGYLTLQPEEIYHRMVEAHTQNWQICIHAIGDKAVDTCITLYERLLESYPRQDHRHRIEHASIVDSSCIERIARLGLVLCCQPLFIRSERHWLPQRLGPKRMNSAYPFKSFIEAGITIAGSSDAPIEDTSVLAAIECCVTRDGFVKEQCLDVDQALAMYTLNAAYAQFEEHEKGSLEVGKRADMVFLERNPYKVEAVHIGSIKVKRTLCAGRQTYGVNLTG